MIEVRAKELKQFLEAVPDETRVYFEDANTLVAYDLSELVLSFIPPALPAGKSETPFDIIFKVVSR